MKRKILLFVSTLLFSTAFYGQNVTIPDTEFKAALLNYSPSIDTNNDNEISVTEAAAVTVLNISDHHYDMQVGDPNDPNGGGGMEIFGISDFTGIEAFTNLTSLICKENDLTNLDVSALTQLTYLDCSNNRNPAGWGGGITGLTLPNTNTLTTLICGSNYLTSLDVSAYTSLTHLNANGNNITTLTLPNTTTLQTLQFGSNQLTTIDLSQYTALTNLILYNNSIANINLPNTATLTNLDCRQNQLTTLDISQNTGLITLDCSNNQLTSLDVNTNTTITSIKCSTNQITGLDLSYLTSLTYIRTFDNALTSLNLKNGNNSNMSSAGFSVANNPNLQLICVDDVTYASANFNNKDATAYFSDICSFIPANSNTITGRVSFDFDANGCSSSDTGYTNAKITTLGSSTSNITFTNGNGEYTIYTQEAAINTEITPNLPSFFTVTPTTQATTFTGSGNTQIIDFCITANQTVNDVKVRVFPISESRPGFDTSVRIIYENVGSSTLSGAVNLSYNNLQESFLNASTAPDSQTSTSLTWNYTNLLPFQRKTIDVYFNINTPTDPTNPVNGGDMLSYTATINPTAGDANTNDNTHTMTDFVVNSHDPNDVTVFEGDYIDAVEIPNYLNYRIRFQNTGTASAINIVVKNILDADLDWTTFQQISASHNYRTSITDGNKVEFIFENIHLADSTSNEPDSHGWVLFKIKPKNTFSLGDVVESTADIYFDYNPAVVTNTATTQLSTTATLSTTAATTITTTTATLAGNITTNGGATITERGIVYSETGLNANPEIGGSDVSKISIGTGIGTFTNALTGLIPGKNYTFKSYAINAAGTSYGNVETFTTTFLTPTITFANQTKEYGSSSFDLNATSDSSGTISYSIIGNANGTSLSGTDNKTVTIGNIGTVTLRATVPVNGSYSASSKDIILTITQKAIEFTADAKNKEYGATDPNFTYQITSGSIVGSDTFTGSLSRATGEDVGTYAISSSLTNNNYAVTFIADNLTITQKAIEITADAKTKEYGVTDPIFTYQITSGSIVGSDTFTGSLSRATGEDVGTYAISSSLANNNYAVTFIADNLTITQKAIEITANEITKAEGDTDPDLTYQITVGHLVSGDSFTGSLSREQGEAIGTYLIQIGSLSISNNYATSFVGATFTITSTASVIDENFNKQFKVYPNPAKNTFTIHSKVNSHYTITNMLGKIVKKGKITIGSNRVDIQNISKGIYLIKMTYENKSITKKIVLN